MGVSVGVIGAGGMGSRHGENLARVPGVTIAAITDPDASAARALARSVGADVMGADELIATVDAVVVASPDDTHAELAVSCIEAGKPLLCEKPMATSVDAARGVVSAEVARGRRLAQVGFMRVYDPAHRDLKTAVDAGAIGRPLHVRADHLNPPWIPRSAERVIVQSAIHDFHSVRWLLDGEIERVQSLVVERGEDSARLVQIQCWVSGGRGALIFVDAHAYGYEVSVELTGESGTAATDAATGTEIRADFGRRRPVSDHWLDRFAAAYVAEAEAWAASVVVGAAPPGPSVWDGYVATCVAEAAVRSVITGEPETVDSGPRPALYDAVETEEQP